MTEAVQMEIVHLIGALVFVILLGVGFFKLLHVWMEKPHQGED